MKSAKEKKKPSDYPIMAFRVSQEDKDRLNDLIDETLLIVNSDLSEEHLKIKKNDLIIDALYSGLIRLKRHRRTGTDN